MTAADIAAKLRCAPLHDTVSAVAADGVPASPGFYAWWAAPDAIPGVQGPPHPSGHLELLYVGIAPSTPASSANLRSRLCRQHIGGNISSSTFRFGLAALLWEREGWTPRRSTSGRYRLAADENRALSGWQRDHLRVGWVVLGDAWRFEKDVITTMQPPMNRAHTARHSFYREMGTARDRLREVARAM